MIFITEQTELTNKAKDVINTYAGTTEVAKYLKRLGVNHTKVYRGAKVVYVLRGVKIGRVEVTL